MIDAPKLHPQDAQQLLEAVSRAAIAANDHAQRRRAVVVALGEIASADAGHWAWGRGDPLGGVILPLAIIDFGYSPEQFAVLVEHNLDRNALATFQSRVRVRMNGSPQIAVTRRDVLTDDEWRTSPLWSNYVARLGLDSWLHAVRYHSGDTWSCLHLLRRTGAPEFGPRERALADLALGGVAWLHAQCDEAVPPDTFANLTPRQRTVLVMLLDGRSRREIASRLGISEYTVGDHLKALYARFGVRTVGELAGRLLKMA